MKKKFAIMALIVVSVIIYISLFMQNSMTIDERIEKVLSTAYTNNYDSYADDYDYKKMEKLENKKLKEVDDLFTERGLEFIKRTRLMTESERFIKEYKCNTSVESFNLDIRETSDIKNKVCYYSIVVKIDFLDENDETVFTELSGSMSLYLEDEVWLIGIILEDQFPFQDIDIEKSSD